MSLEVTLHDLRLDSVRAAYESGNLTPRQLILALREKAAALNPEYHLFIHLLTPNELEPYLAALEGRDIKDLPLTASLSRSRTTSIWQVFRRRRLAWRMPTRLNARRRSSSNCWHWGRSPWAKPIWISLPPA